jgi:Sec-independent protein translocase protein TatA
MLVFFLFFALFSTCEAFVPPPSIRGVALLPKTSAFTPAPQNHQLQHQRRHRRGQTALQDILGLGPAEIAVTLVVALVLFGPETLKSLSKDVGKAAAELKEIPKTFKEGMDEGAESVQVSKMKAIAAEKKALRDAKMAAAAEDDDEDDEEEEEDE